MQDVNVVIVFCSRKGAVERLALAAAVGAVQGRANIRLRWLRESADDATIASDPEWKENRERMIREYVTPRETDASWADAVIVGIPERVGLRSPELKDYLDSLAALASQGKLAARVGLGFCSSPAGSAEALCSALSKLGLISSGSAPVMQSTEDARLLGRQIAETARAKKREAHAPA
jgi:hypothetical protein